MVYSSLDELLDTVQQVLVYSANCRAKLAESRGSKSGRKVDIPLDTLRGRMEACCRKKNFFPKPSGATIKSYFSPFEVSAQHPNKLLIKWFYSVNRPLTGFKNSTLQKYTI